MPASPHNPITHASIKAAILYIFSRKTQKCGEIPQKVVQAVEDFYDS